MQVKGTEWVGNMKNNEKVLKKFNSQMAQIQKFGIYFKSCRSFKVIRIVFYKE